MAVYSRFEGAAPGERRVKRGEARKQGMIAGGEEFPQQGFSPGLIRQVEGVVAKGADIREAREKVYAEVAKIDCDNLFYRKDIAHIALEQ